MARKPVLIDLQTVEDGDAVERVEDPDAEFAWDGWISDLRNSQASGMIRVARLPTDKDGAPLPNAKGQVQLGSWPHDQYDYDGLLAHIRQRFMKPGETMHIRIQGFEAGKAGVKVNQIVSLQRDAAPSGSEVVTSQLGEVLSAMREDRAALTHTLQSLMNPAAPIVQAPASSVAPAIKEIAIAAMPIIGSVLAAIISRPAKPPTDLMGLVEIAQLLAGKEPRESDDDTSMAGIVKAVAGPGLQLLNTLAQNAGRAPTSMPQARPARLPQPATSAAPIATVHATPGNAPVAAVQLAESISDASALDASTSTSHEEKSMLALLKPQLEELCTLAERGTDAVEAAKLTAQLLPEQFDEQLGAILETPQSFARLQLLAPKMKSHAAWFETFRVALYKEMFGAAEASSGP